ncbi:MAG: hypothetical protein ACJ8G1_10740 [Vitreoscilla sp.]|jgi:hypothetical protein
MARIPSPLHGKSVPKRVSKPTVTAEAAATVAESAVAAPAPRRARAAKAATAGKKAVPANKGAAPPAKAKAKAVPAKKAKAASGATAKTSTRPTAGPAGPAPAKPAKAHKAKLVRDSFTIPKDEYAVLAALKSRALGLGQHVRKSELLRAGIQALAGLDDGAFLKAVGAVPTLKTGRPKKG